jgi:ribosomal protein L11 methyltransferase
LKTYPALDVRTDAPEFVLALVDDFAPAAAEEHGAVVRVFFATTADRDAAQRSVGERFDVTPIDVSDEDWARRSQENLQPVTVGAITIAPRVQPPFTHPPNPQSPAPNPLVIVIQPSMGFGTGHHASTRLCLAALQTLALGGRVVVDVGTGSGVLAIAAARLGAASAVGIDNDPDAIQSAQENWELNGRPDNVRFATADLGAQPLPSADVVTANLTGALLTRSARRLLEAVRPDGTLVASGILAEERDQVAAAFAPAAIVWEREEDGWIGLAVKKSWQ